MHALLADAWAVSDFFPSVLCNCLCVCVCGGLVGGEEEMLMFRIRF